MDRKQVTMLSTCHTSEMVELPPNRRGVVKTKPRVVVDYNGGMKGVDVSDQLAASYPTPRKTVNLLDMVVVNATPSTRPSVDTSCSLTSSWS